MVGKYTVAEVEARSGVPASSLRQWERRYGFPMPQRSSSGYRLYRDEDLRHIESMRRLIADGVPVSRAAVLVRDQGARKAGPRPTVELASELVDALVTLDELRSGRVLSESFALHSVEDVLLDVITPAMVTIGEQWHAGEILVTTEHFATNLVQGRLRSLLTLMPSPLVSRTVLVACAPQERHELGALVVAVLLRRAGLNAIYLGADTPMADLLAMTRELAPDAVLLSATLASSGDELRRHRVHLRNLECLLVVGGRAFDESPDLTADLDGLFLGNDARTVIPKVAMLIEDIAAVRP